MPPPLRKTTYTAPRDSRGRTNRTPVRQIRKVQHHQEKNSRNAESSPENQDNIARPAAERASICTQQKLMAPIWRRSSTEDDAVREAVRAAAHQRRDIYIQIRWISLEIGQTRGAHVLTFPNRIAHLRNIYPASYTALIVRTRKSAGAVGSPCYVALVLREIAQSSRLSPTNPVLRHEESYFDDRLLAEDDMARYTVLLNGIPGCTQTEGMERLLERIQVLERSGWRSET